MLRLKLKTFQTRTIGGNLHYSFETLEVDMRRVFTYSRSNRRKQLRKEAAEKHPGTAPPSRSSSDDSNVPPRKRRKGETSKTSRQ